MRFLSDTRLAKRPLLLLLLFTLSGCAALEVERYDTLRQETLKEERVPLFARLRIVENGEELRGYRRLFVSAFLTFARIDENEAHKEIDVREDGTVRLLLQPGEYYIPQLTYTDAAGPRKVYPKALFRLQRGKALYYLGTLRFTLTTEKGFLSRKTTAHST